MSPVSQVSGTAAVGKVFDQEGGFDVVPGWSAQSSDETMNGTDPPAGCAGSLTFGSGYSSS